MKCNRESGLVRVAIQYLNAGLRAISFELAQSPHRSCREPDLTAIASVAFQSTRRGLNSRLVRREDDDIDLLYVRRDILVSFGWLPARLITLLYFLTNTSLHLKLTRALRKQLLDKPDRRSCLRAPPPCL